MNTFYGGFSIFLSKMPGIYRRNTLLFFVEYFYLSTSACSYDVLDMFQSTSKHSRVLSVLNKLDIDKIIITVIKLQKFQLWPFLLDFHPLLKNSLIVSML